MKVLASALLALMPAAIHAAAAPDWKPERAIEIVVGVTPGGPADTSARMLQRILQDRKMVAVPVSVSNKAGANNALACFQFRNFTAHLHNFS